MDNTFGKAFPIATVYAGYMMLILGLVLAVTTSLGAIVLSLLGAFVAFPTYGIQIDQQNKNYKNYTNFFGFKFGKWESYEKYPDLSVLNKTLTSTGHSRTNTPNTTDSSKFYDIYLLSANHRQKLLVKRVKSKELATKESFEIANMLGVQLKDYAPEISASTRARR